MASGDARKTTPSPPPTAEPTTTTDSPPVGTPSTARIDSLDTPFDAARSNLSVRVSPLGVLSIARTRSVLDDQRTIAATDAHQVPATGKASQPLTTTDSHVSSASGHRGRAPEPSSERTARVLRRRDELAEIRSRFHGRELARCIRPFIAMYSTSSRCGVAMHPRRCRRIPRSRAARDCTACSVHH